MQLTFKAEDAKHPENKGIGYAWKVTPGMEKADTVKTEELIIEKICWYRCQFDRNGLNQHGIYHVITI